MAKATKSATKKIIVTHPRTGTERNFDATIYTAFKAAIIKSLQKGNGKTFTQLTDNVIKIIQQKMPRFKGSIPWYTISILLDLQSRGIVETFIEKGKKLNRLRTS
jgi:hypothetical protein